VRDLNLPGGVDESRFATRRSALEAVNAHFVKKEKSDNIAAMNSFYESAYSLISSPQAREAFNLEAEPAALRDEYGRNTAGARMLLARRLVEAGVRLVNLTYGGWDMHDQIVAGFRNQMPQFDQAFARLILDLETRGLLDSTLVMVSSEFGRTPKINGTAGRDHWPKVFSVVLAGGGVKKGFVYGTSNPTASEPDENPVTVENLFTTVYHCLGIVADKELMAPGDRPIEICDGGDVIQDLLAYDFYTPEIYRRTIVNPVASLARLTRWFDIYVVKGLVDGVGRLSMATAEGLKLSVSGQLQSYVLTLILSIVLLLITLQSLRGGL